MSLTGSTSNGAVAATEDRRALVVEDDEDIRGLIELALQSQGFAVTTVDNGLSGVETIRTLDPDLVTLDLGLPGIDGIETCRRMRELTDAYVIMITARDEEIDKLLGLETGADDFLAKPFSVRELKARVNVLFRRPRRLPAPAEGAGRLPASGDAVTSAPPEAPSAPSAPAAPASHEVLDHGPLRVDVDGRRAFRDGTELTLTRTEFDLLTELMRTPARVWSRESLLRSVWGTEWATDTHLVEVHMGNLRRKLGGGRLIHTVRGVGYRMEAL